MRWKYEVLVFKVFGGGYFNSHLILLEIVVGFRTVVDYAKDFSKNTGQFKGVTRETIYHVSIAELLTRNLKSQITKLVGRLKTYHLLISVETISFCKIHRGKSLYITEVENVLFIGRGVVIWYLVGNFSKIIYRGTNLGTSHWGTWTGCSKDVEILLKLLQLLLHNFNILLKKWLVNNQEIPSKT